MEFLVYTSPTLAAWLLLYTWRTRVVDGNRARPDSSGVPTIAELLNSYRDRTGASYGDMARKVRDEIQISRLQQLATAPPKEFPKQPRTIELLAELLEMPITTIVLGFAAGLGIPVRQEGTLLERTLPPGTDVLDDEERAAIRAVTGALVRARGQVARSQVAEEPPPVPDFDTAEGLRLAPDETPARRPANGPQSAR